MGEKELRTAKILQHQFEELRERASKDALSGLLNRATAQQYIVRRLKDLGAKDSCALFIVDLDNFKDINDTLGHLAGDQAIRQSARILSGLFRANDIVGRLGGDEFFIFLTGQITEKLVQKKGQAICQSLQLVMGAEPAVSLTASVGICLASGGGHQFEDLYQAADLALYKAKKKGKHSYCLSGLGEGAVSSESLPPVNTIPLTGLLEDMNSGVALLEMGEILRLVYVSPSFCRIIGVDPLEYLLPKPLFDVIHPDDRVNLERILREGLDQNQPAEHIHRVSPDGKSWFWWHIRAVRIEYSGPYPVMLVTTTDVTPFKEKEQRLQEINQRLQTAFEQTTQSLWEVDIPSGIFRIFDPAGKFCPHREGRQEFPESLLLSGWIHPSSASPFQEFAAELMEGKDQGYGNFIVQYRQTGCYGWAALSYRMLYDEAGRAVKAVGIIENLPRNFIGQKAGPILKRSLPEALTSCLVMALGANLTRDTLQELWLEGKDQNCRAREGTCSLFLKEEKARLFSEDDRKTLARYFSREGLLQCFAQGQRWFTIEYRRTDSGGNIRWVSQVSNLAEDPLTREVYLFVYLSSLDQRRMWEQSLGETAVRDSVTGLYDRPTFRALTETCLRGGGPALCAAALIRLGGLLRLYTGDAQDMDQKRSWIAAALSVALGTGCIIGQYERDQFLVFFPEAGSQLKLRSQMEEAFSFVRLVLADSLAALDSLRFVAGVVCGPAAAADYGTMLAQAAEVCRLWENAAADTVAFPQKEGGWSWTELQSGGEEDQIIIHQNEMERPLSEAEKDVALGCVSAMLSSNSLEASILSILGQIGAYYHADRTYILTLAENRHVVTMPYEWTGQKKHSIQQAVSGTLLERYPLLKRCIREQAPVFLTRTRSGIPPKEKDPGDPWYFTVFPLIREKVIEGFLCIENARRHPSEAALFSTLIPHILREQQRFQGCRAASEGQTPGTFLTGLPNLRSYLEIIHTLNSDRYSSLGAVCLDIPGLASINSSLGFEYGSKLLWYVSKTLTDLFGSRYLFRTWDAEFAALCPNVTQQVFLGRCTRLRSMLQRRYPGDLRIGYTWADKVFSGKKLVSEARSIMRCDSAEAVYDAETAALGFGGYIGCLSVGEAVMQGRFTVFFQPRIDLRTGKLQGAEALVRGLDEAGAIVSPSHFIENLEKSGGIRDLDLFVLDRTLQLADKWRQEKLGILPVSVNFSRVTLFNPTALASVLAIQSRYPQLPPAALELEITESAGNVEKINLTEVMESFRQFGLRFALDDFGSEYANLSIFTSVKFDTVKLDRSLVAGLCDNPINQMLIKDIVQICHACGMACVAEGVETAAQAAALKEAGCCYAQGYYYDPPLSPERFQQKYLKGAGF